MESVEIYLGTGGYSNEDWVGLLYPPEAKKEEWLSIYARHYNAVELNSSFYNIPGRKAFAGMLRRSQGQVQWAIKIHQSMTHQRNASHDDYQRLFESVAPCGRRGYWGLFWPSSRRASTAPRKTASTLPSWPSASPTKAWPPAGWRWSFAMPPGIRRRCAKRLARPA